MGILNVNINKEAKEFEEKLKSHVYFEIKPGEGVLVPKQLPVKLISEINGTNETIHIPAGMLHQLIKDKMEYDEKHNLVLLIMKQHHQLGAKKGWALHTGDPKVDGWNKERLMAEDLKVLQKFYKGIKVKI